MKRTRNRKVARMSGGNCSREMERPANFPRAEGERIGERALPAVLLRLGLMLWPAALALGPLGLGRGRTRLRRRPGLGGVRGVEGAAVGPGLRPRHPGLVDRLGLAGPLRLLIAVRTLRAAG